MISRILNFVEARADSGPTITRFSIRLYFYHIDWINHAADIHPAALADGEIDNTVMFAENAAVDVDDFAIVDCAGAKFLDDAGIITVLVRNKYPGCQVCCGFRYHIPLRAGGFFLWSCCQVGSGGIRVVLW